MCRCENILMGQIITPTELTNGVVTVSHDFSIFQDLLLTRVKIDPFKLTQTHTPKYYDILTLYTNNSKLSLILQKNIRYPKFSVKPNQQSFQTDFDLPLWNVF